MKISLREFKSKSKRGLRPIRVQIMGVHLVVCRLRISGVLNSGPREITKQRYRLMRMGVLMGVWKIVS